MKLIRKDQAIHVDKTNGTKVDYYLLNDAEIHYNIINPRTLQEWHRHHRISENIFMHEKWNKRRYFTFSCRNIIQAQRS